MNTTAQTFNSFDRAYRKQLSSTHKYSFQVVIEESDLFVCSSHNIKNDLLAELHALRAIIKSWSLIQPEFQHSLVPVIVPEDAPNIIKRMAQAAAFATVGPFATVAGAIAQSLGEFFNDVDSILIENGGDTYIRSHTDTTIGILPNPETGKFIGITVKATATGTSLCGSSPKIGHSLSFGEGDLVIIRAADAFVADAFATACGNMLHTADGLPQLIEYAQSKTSVGIEGIFAQAQGSIAIWGNMELATCR